ncbi:MAG: hypothetical protein J6X55_01115, partial [Victivallales bacterium]|nr:hypothetical protein [Victivallales bacterium]
SYEVSNIDRVAPDAPTASASTTAPTNQSVTVTAVFSVDSAKKQYSVDGTAWKTYTKGIAMSANGTVYFRGIDAAGNISEVTSYEVSNIDTVAPSVREFIVSEPATSGLTTVSMVADEKLAQQQYSWNGGEWADMSDGTLSVASNGTVRFRLVDQAGNETITDGYTIDVFNKTVSEIEQQIAGDGVAVVNWSGDATATWAQEYDVRLTTQAGAIHLPNISADGIELLNAPTAEFAVSVKPQQSDLWTNVDGTLEVHNADADGAPRVILADGDGLADVMFARGTSAWDGNYQARHVGVGDWGGTGQTAALVGRNVIDDIFAGSDDASILLLTDDTNGDALFVDDVYSAFPEGLDAQSRIAKINEIRAGAGDDIVDLTSQRFEYVGGGMTVRGGLGDDVIWANKGDNRLFGDAGDDQIIGASGNDVIVGGAGDDALQGGGGDDIFAFGGDWGRDTVEQLENGKVTLWFDDGDESKWNARTLTYTDGDKSVKVTGVAAGSISLKFGDDDSERYGELLASGAFGEITSEKIFEDKNKGMLA